MMKVKSVRTAALMLCVCMFWAGCGGARVIEVKEVTGEVKVSRETDTHNAIVGEHLVSGESVSVSYGADLLLTIDSDKYLYADALTKFDLVASGTENASKTKIILTEGNVLCGLDKKLDAHEKFEVETPNALMAVRGTVFLVRSSYDADGTPVTSVSVTEGYVMATYQENGAEETITIEAGETADFVGYRENVSAFYSGGKIRKEDDPGLGKMLPIGAYAFDEYYDYIELTGTMYTVADLYPEEYKRYMAEFNDDSVNELLLFILDEPYNGESMLDLAIM